MKDSKESVKQTPKFGTGHMCGGCGWSMIYHTGCVVDGDAKAVIFRPQKTSRTGETNQNDYSDITDVFRRKRPSRLS